MKSFPKKFGGPASEIQRRMPGGSRSKIPEAPESHARKGQVTLIVGLRKRVASFAAQRKKPPGTAKTQKGSPPASKMSATPDSKTAPHPHWKAVSNQAPGRALSMAARTPR